MTEAEHPNEGFYIEKIDWIDMVQTEQEAKDIVSKLNRENNDDCVYRYSNMNPSPPSTDKALGILNLAFGDSKAAYWTLKERIAVLMEEYALNVGREQYNQGIEDVMKLTYEQTLESGSVVDVIEVTELIKLKKP